jgi:hypothetical protein
MFQCATRRPSRRYAVPGWQYGFSTGGSEIRPYHIPLREDVLPFSSETHKIFPVEKSLSSGVSTTAPTTSVRTQGPSSWFRRDWSVVRPARVLKRLSHRTRLS